MSEQALQTITIPSGSTTPIVVSGLGHRPEAILAFYSGRTETIDAVGAGTARQGFGAAISAATQFVAQRRLVSGGDASTNTQALLTGFLVATEGGGRARVAAIEEDGFLLVPTAAFPTALRVHVLTLGPALVTAKALFSFLTPQATGTQSLTAPGFQPDAAVFFSCCSEGASDDSSHASLSLGWAAGPNGSIGSFAVATHSRGNGVGADAKRWARPGYVYGEPSKAPNVNDIVERATVSQWLATGVELTYDLATVTGNNVVACLALQGPGFRAGSLTLGQEAISGLPWPPRAALFASHGKVAQVDAEMDARDAVGIGAYSLSASALVRRASYATNQDGPSSQVVGTRIDHDAVYARVNAALAAEGELTVDQVRNDGLGLTLIEPSAADDLVGYLALGFAAPTITQDRTATVPDPGTSTASRIADFIKDPDAVLDYAVDWTNFLRDDDGNVVDAVASSVWITPSEVTALLDPPATFTSTATRAWFSGGEVGQSYDVVNRITTANGRTDDRTIRLKVKER